MFVNLINLLIIMKFYLFFEFEIYITIISSQIFDIKNIRIFLF